MIDDDDDDDVLVLFLVVTKNSGSGIFFAPKLQLLIFFKIDRMNRI
jgi:hypothetical protein